MIAFKVRAKAKRNCVAIMLAFSYCLKRSSESKLKVGKYFFPLQSIKSVKHLRYFSEPSVVHSTWIIRYIAGLLFVVVWRANSVNQSIYVNKTGNRLNILHIGARAAAAAALAHITYLHYMFICTCKWSCISSDWVSLILSANIVIQLYIILV